jgi:hypothetical protein
MIAEYLLAYGLMFASHEAGHDLQANREGIKLAWKWSANRPDGAIPGPIWEYDPDNRRASQKARMEGAGFLGQDTLSKVVQGTRWEKPVRLASAYQKLGSVFWFPGENNGSYIYGDVRSLEYYTGSKAASYALTASALFDIYKALNPETKWSLDFHQFNRGAPGLKFTIDM